MYTDEGSVPALMFERLLADSGIACDIGSDAAVATPQAGKVTLCYAADGAAAIRAVKSKDSADYYGIVGEPAVSIAAVKNGLGDKGSLQTLCGGGYSQAVLIAKASVAERIADQRAVHCDRRGRGRSLYGNQEQLSGDIACSLYQRRDCPQVQRVRHSYRRCKRI